MLVHLNSQLLPLQQAHVSPLDRGFLFGDGIYEGLRAFGGRVVAIDLHIKRMQAGLDAARIPWDVAQLTRTTTDLLAANNLKDAFIYWQVTRGAPAPGQPPRTRRLEGKITPTVFGYCNPTPALSAYEPPNPPPAKTMATIQDPRWLRGQVKSISLLGSVLAALEADEAGSEDALLVRDGLVAETTSANVILALPRRDGTTELVTPSLTGVPILAGVTRDLLIAAATRHGPKITERAVHQEELAEATEIMACGTLTMVTSIVKLDGRRIGDGTPGPTAHKLLATLLDEIRAKAPSRREG
jgi:D-alanine transaminase